MSRFFYTAVFSYTLNRFVFPAKNAFLPEYLQHFLKHFSFFFGRIKEDAIFALPNRTNGAGKTKSRVRLSARTSPFHGGKTGSIPVRGTKRKSASGPIFLLYSPHHRFLLFLLVPVKPISRVPPIQYDLRIVKEGIILQESNE